MTAKDEDKNGHEKDILGQIGVVVVEEDVKRYLGSFNAANGGNEGGRRTWEGAMD
jgi:hypothetical protein